MQKVFKSILVAMTVLVMVAPALAEVSVNGYFRTQATGEDFSLTKDGNSSSFVDNRLRMKVTNTLNENLKLVYFGEVDTPWGLKGKAASGGGELGADGVNIETKNVYANYKASIFDVTIGVQNFNDHVSDLVMDNDAAGITAKMLQGPVDVALVYSKLYENDSAEWDDHDLYGLQTGFTIKDTHRIGFDVMYFDNNADYVNATAGNDSSFDATTGRFTNGVSATSASGGEVTQIFYSLNGDFKVGNSNIKGWFLYGTEDREGNPAIGTDDVDGGNWAANLKFGQTFGKGDMSVCAIYIVPADKQEDIVLDDDHGTVNAFYQEGLSIFLTDMYYTSYSTQGARYRDAANTGYGLTSLSARGKINLPSDMYVNCALGAFMAADDIAYDDPVTKREGTYMGTELDLGIGKTFAEKFDLSLRGAYAVLGDFYDNTASGDDPENFWKVVAMLNIAY